MAYPESPQWRGGQFDNPPGSPGLPGPRALLRWLAQRAPELPPRYSPPRVDNDGAALDGRRPSVTWIGHATMLLQLGGITILTDTVFARQMGL